jgi:hypothetical protein
MKMAEGTDTGSALRRLFDVYAATITHSSR